MNSRKFLILLVSGLALLLLLPLSNVNSLASTSAPAAPGTALSSLLVEDGVLAQAGVNVMPTFSVTMTPDPATLDEPGGTVTFTIVIFNEGVDEISIVEVVDNVYGGLKTGDGDPPLDPDVTDNTCADLTSIPGNSPDQCSFNAPVTGPPGDYFNNVTVTAEDSMSVQHNEMATAMVTIADVPSSIEVTLSAVPTSVPEPGGNVEFTVNVHNTSTVDTIVIETLTGTAPLGNLNGQGDCTMPQTIAVGASYECSATVPVSGTPGQVTDFTVTAEGTDDDGVAVEDVSNSVQISITDVPSSIVTTLSAVPTSVPEPGGSVEFTVHVDNTSAVDAVTITTLTGNSLIGDLNGQGDCAVPQTIAAGTSYECAAAITVTGNAGQQRNFTVTASGTDDDGVAVSGGSNAVQITITDVPSSIETTLSAAPTSVPEPGGSVAFTIRVDNTSAVDTVTISTLNGTAPLSNLHGKGNCSLPQTITAGAFYQCSATVTVNGTSGQVKNFTVTASGADDDDATVNDESNMVQITITAPDITQIFLPVVMRVHVIGEPNNTCAQAYGISTNTDFYFLPDDKEDWYRFNLAGPGNLAVELTNFVPVMGQIVLYQGSSCGTLQFIANNGNFSSTKTINTAVGAGTYYVRVITDGPFSSTPYKLRIGFP